MSSYMVPVEEGFGALSRGHLSPVAHPYRPDSHCLSVPVSARGLCGHR